MKIYPVRMNAQKPFGARFSTLHKISETREFLNGAVVSVAATVPMFLELYLLEFFEKFFAKRR